MLQGAWRWSWILVVVAGACGDEAGGGSGGDAGGVEPGIIEFDAAVLPRPRDAGIAPRVDAAGSLDGMASSDAGMGPDMRRFVPDVPLSYVGTIVDPGVEIVGFTLHEHPSYPGQFEFLAAVRNVSADLRLCAADLETMFRDGGGARLGRGFGLIESPLHRGSSGAGGLINCISPGQTGMQAVLVDLGSRTIDDVTSITWTIGALNVFDAVPSADLTVTDVMAIAAPGGRVFTGRLENRGRRTVTGPRVTLFGLNVVGRPLFASSDIESIDVAPAGSWGFETGPSFDEAYDSHAAFLLVRER
jgi:hypothetical protein